MDEMTRLEHLIEMIQGAQDRMLDPGCGDQNFAVLGRLRRELLVEVEEIEPAGAAVVTGLSEFERKLSEREKSSTKTARRPAAG